MAPVTVLVHISPNPGKLDRVQQLVTDTIEAVKKSEPDMLSYHSYRTEGKTDGEEGQGLTDFVVVGVMKDKEWMMKRRELQHHQDIARFIKEEKLLRRPMRYQILEALGGFDR